MTVVAGADSLETERLSDICLFDIDGPCYMRFAREATPVVTTMKTPLVFGKANVIRFRKEAEKFIDAFETTLASEYESEKEDVAIISNGPEIAESMRAAWILKSEYGIETRIVNLHTMKPLDKDAVARAAKECGAVLTAEEHQVGGIGNLVAAAIMKANINKAVVFDMIGVNDEFGLSGGSWELVKVFGLSAEHIARKAKELVDKKP